MKKQSDTHSPSRIRESETPANNIPAPAFTESRPRGVMDRAHSGHVTRGAAESPTNPVTDTNPVKDTPSESHSAGRKPR